MVFYALSDDLIHVLYLFTWSAVAAVDDRLQGRVLVKVSVSALLQIMIQTRLCPYTSASHWFLESLSCKIEGGPTLSPLALASKTPFPLL